MKRWGWEFGGAMVLYTATVPLTSLLLHRVGDAAWRPLIALLPTIPTALALVAFVRYLQRTDELQRAIHLQAASFAFAGAGLLTFAYGWLENAGLPRLSMVLVLPLMIALWGIGMAVAERRYR
jgi:CHASE2 domain-containing sensor protein